ncbi:SdrD B-like domain-containing protein [Deinococcus arboris]|uniref:SdrD B-like domain-containing protein n=1 Tax=Deinococcus arboris TaxID=2682977 RepID=UPI0018DE3096|nr:SdrD B-like domain-containing protein [Deinococcus arboris]
MAVSLCFLALTAAGAQAQTTPAPAQVTNTAQLRAGPLSIPSNTVDLTLRAPCVPQVTVLGGTEGTPLSAPGLLTLPYRVAQLGDAEARVALEAHVQGAAPEDVQVRVQDSAAPNAQPVDALSLAPGQSRDVVVAVLISRPLRAELTVALTATCGSGRAVSASRQVLVTPAAALLLTHTARPTGLAVGDRATGTLSLPNPTAGPLTPSFTVTLPVGLDYVPGSARQGDTPVEATVSADGRRLTLPARPAAASETTTLTYAVRATPAALATPRLTLLAQATATIDGAAQESGVVPAQVAILAGPFDRQATLVGTVYTDVNGNGRREDGEPAVVGARVLLSNGLQTLTDRQGEYTFRQLTPGPWQVRVEQPGGETARRLVDVQSLSRADFALTPTSTAGITAAQPAAPDEATGLIRQPLNGQVLSGRDRVNIAVQFPVGEPLTLRVNGQPVPETLVGEAGEAGGQQRLVYVGVPLRPGTNVLEAQSGDRTERVQVQVAGAAQRLTLNLVPGTQADGQSPVQVDLRAVDAAGQPSGSGTVTLSSSLEFLDLDADPRTSGYQVALRGGQALVRLAPLTAATEIRLDALYGDLRGQAALYVPAAQRQVTAFQVSAGLAYSAGTGLRPTFQARGYAEQPLLGGEIQAVLDTAGLPAPNDPAATPRRFSVTGSGTEASAALSSDLGFALRYERADLSLGYYHAPLTLDPLAGLPRTSALRGEYRSGAWRVRAFAARMPLNQTRETFVPDGGRQYRLSGAAQPGSEVVRVERGGQDVTLRPGLDYVLDPETGTLTLAQGLNGYGPEFALQTLVVTYQPAGAAAAQALAYGVGVGYAQGPWQLDAAAAVQAGTPIFGVRAAYRSDALTLSAAYARDLLYPQGRATLDGQYRAGPVSASVSLSHDPSRPEPLAGSAEAAYQAGPFGVRLAHRLLGGAGRTTLSAERAVTPTLALGAGLEVTWPTEAAPHPGLSGVVLARYARSGISAEVSHASPLLSTGSPQTRLNVSAALGPATTLRARVVQDWAAGGAPSGELGIEQTLGPTNLDVTYQLPTAAGQASRARLGLHTPIVLSDRLSADLSGSVTRDLGSGAMTVGGTFGVRYVTDTLVATASLDGTSAQGGRVTLRGGVTGSLGDHTLGADARVQLRPDLRAEFTVSHAWRTSRLALMQYHRLSQPINGNAAPVLEGEAAAYLTLPEFRSLELSPSLAYRVPLGGTPTVQGGLSLGLPLTSHLGLGASAYLIGQPSAGVSGAYGADVRYLLRDGLRVVAGYTWGAGAAQGLTPGARPGAFIRFDLFGGQ